MATPYLAMPCPVCRQPVPHPAATVCGHCRSPIKYGVLGFKADGPSERAEKDARRAAFAQNRASDGPIFNKMCWVAGIGLVVLMLLTIMIGPADSDASASLYATGTANESDDLPVDYSSSAAPQVTYPTYDQAETLRLIEVERQRQVELRAELDVIKSKLAEEQRVAEEIAMTQGPLDRANADVGEAVN